MYAKKTRHCLNKIQEMKTKTEQQLKNENFTCNFVKKPFCKGFINEASIIFGEIIRNNLITNCLCPDFGERASEQSPIVITVNHCYF